jgi:hypothetical protein
MAMKISRTYEPGPNGTVIVYTHTEDDSTGMKQMLAEGPFTRAQVHTNMAECDEARVKVLEQAAGQAADLAKRYEFWGDALANMPEPSAPASAPPLAT